MRERGFDDWVLYWMQRNRRSTERRDGRGPETPSSGQEIAAFLRDLAIIFTGFFGVIVVLRLIVAVLR